MVKHIGPWVEERHGKRHATVGRTGAVVHVSKKGSMAEMLVISVLHLSLQKPVLKTFERVKVQKRSLKPFQGTNTCGVRELNRKLVDVLAKKHGIRRNARGRAIRCTQKVTPIRKSAAQRNNMVTPTKEALASTQERCFSGAKAQQSRRPSRGAETRTLEVVFRTAADVKNDSSTYASTMTSKKMKVCDWKPYGQPRIVDATGKVYKGKPQCLRFIAFPLIVTMNLTRTVRPS